MFIFVKSVLYHLDKDNHIHCIIDNELNNTKSRYKIDEEEEDFFIERDEKESNVLYLRNKNKNVAKILINKDMFKSDITGFEILDESFMNICYLLMKYIGYDMYCVSREKYNEYDKIETVRLSGFDPESLVNGEGSRKVVFFQGCSLNCPGCFNPCTHSFTGGEEYNIEEFVKEKLIDDPLVNGITFSGGNPLESPQELATMIYLIKEYRPDLSIWIYTGFDMRKVLMDAVTNGYYRYILAHTDVIVDGMFMEDLKGEYKYRGSYNQKFIDVKNTILKNELVFLNY